MQDLDEFLKKELNLCVICPIAEYESGNVIEYFSFASELPEDGQRVNKPHYYKFPTDTKWKKFYKRALEMDYFYIGISPNVKRTAYESDLGFCMIKYEKAFRGTKYEQKVFHAQSFVSDRTERNYANKDWLKRTLGEPTYLALYAMSDNDRLPTNNAAKIVAETLQDSFAKMPLFDPSKMYGERLADDVGIGA